MALRKESDEPTERENARTPFLTFPESEDTREILRSNYHKSFVSAIQLPPTALEEEGLNLLILVHLCAAPFVPEEVVRVLHHRIQGESTKFQVLRTDLEDRRLIKITSQSRGPEYPGKEKSWSVHSLQRQFMREDAKMRTLQENMLASILAGTSSAVNTVTKVEPEIVTEFSTDEDAMVSIALCSLYFDRKFALQAASKMGVDQSRFEEKFNSLRRNAIEPVTRLLGQPVSERWTPHSQVLTKQVFLEYICSARLHSNGIVYLLSSKMSTLPMLNALTRVATIKENQLLTSETQGIVTTLVGLLRNWDKSDSFESFVAALAIESLSEDPAHKGFIISSGLLEVTVKILSSDSTSNLQVALTKMLSGLASSKEIGLSSHEDLIFRTLKTEGLLGQQINYFCRKIDPRLQAEASRVVFNLGASASEEMRLRILDSGALQQLVSSLSKDGNPQLQTHAAAALANLGCLEKAASKIFHFEGAMEQLANALSKDTNRDLQEQAARAFVNLASSSLEEVKLGILDSRALQLLVNSLSKDRNPVLQMSAAWALAYLGSLEKPALKIFYFPGAMEQLANALSKNTNRNLQEKAARAFGNLARSSLEEVKLGILDSGGLQLVNSLSKYRNPGLQAQAAWALANISRSSSREVKLRILDSGALQQLVSSLSEDGNPCLQTHAAAAFANLAASASEEIKFRILDSGALQQLVNSLSKDSNQGLQIKATVALNLLAISSSEEVKLRILGSGALQQLVNVLSKDGPPELQVEAGLVLLNLGELSLEEVILEIFDSGAPLEQLLTFSSTSPELQAEVARALTNLGHQSLGQRESIIVHDGILPKRTNLLSNESLQQEVVRALDYLGNTRVMENK